MVPVVRCLKIDEGLMGHKIIDDPAWHDDIVRQDHDGWVFQMSGAVGHLSLDDALRLQLGGGAEILLQTPFQLQQDASVLHIDLSKQSDRESIGRLLNQTLQKAAASSRGTLQMTFGQKASADLTLVANPESWHIHFPDGRACWGLKGGGIGLFPPEYHN